ncbi:ESX-1 secretion-associated protein [Amycolatopsis lurida]|uniref:ESX-1 secretion-associated protein n=1 Tax=Amycolatopsis sp. YIM 10 TaxID=2653857 RepID=UPI00128FE1CE|nr:ESX-1 secretion-associated protein [Amycolatopsis sp. YIM 10]QFU94009.1 hypothetical protein YIM_44375 [Amycolatopsis sp. YIM 10]
MPDGSGFNAKHERLKDFSADLTKYEGWGNDLKSKVTESDVADKSWGLVGLMTKDNYSTMLAELNDLLGQLNDGVLALSTKFERASQAYQSTDQDFAKGFSDLLNEINTGGSASGGGNG